MSPHLAAAGSDASGNRATASPVLLDIEGTTCPVSFVSGTLFPYAAEHLGSFLSEQSTDQQVQDLLA